MNEAIETMLRKAAALGMQVQVRLGPRYDARVGAPLRLGDLAPWARGGLLLLSGGSAFFTRFAAEMAADGSADPLDRWTRASLERLLAPMAAAGIRAEARYPFWNEAEPLPFQRIGAAAGLATAPPLGLTIDPIHGPWIAYRALILLDVEVGDDGSERPFEPCAACAAPCISACPAGAVARTGWDAVACTDHRLDRGDPCADGCHARIACPLGGNSRYSTSALRFHQAASLAGARAHRTAVRFR